MFHIKLVERKELYISLVLKIFVAYIVPFFFKKIGVRLFWFEIHVN
jgi:hypothetical protein